MKVAYKFDSKHLGQAFMEELVEMGYGRFDNDSVDRFHLIFQKNKKVCFTSVVNFTEPIFQLETQWKEALEFAKAQLDKPELGADTWCYAKGNSVGFYIFKYDGSEVFFTDQRGCQLPSQKGGWNNNTVRKATKEEITEALIKEAERRGFYDTTKYIKNTFNLGQSQDEPRKIQQYHDDKEISYKYVEDNDSLYCDSGMKTFRKFCSNPTIYKNGKWADVVENDMKFFEWDVERTDLGGITFAPDCEAFFFEEEDMQTIISALEFVKHKKVSEVLDELKKLNL